MVDYIYVVCEGQSESSFVKFLLSPYVQEYTCFKWFLVPYTVITSNDKANGRVYRGGLNNYAKARNDIIRLLKNNRPLTTMFDFFRLPTDFPGFDQISSLKDDNDKVHLLEAELKKDICAVSKAPESFFLPYIQLHEFEALFFAV